jgi:Cu2+-exporting ATPase
MRRFFTLLVCCLVGFANANAQDSKNNKETVTFYVEDMECMNCVKKVEKNIPFEKGVTGLQCNLENRTVKVTYKTDKTSKTKLASAFKKIGLPAVSVDNGAGCAVPSSKKKQLR